MTLEIPDLGALVGHVPGGPLAQLCPFLCLHPPRDLSRSSSTSQEATEGKGLGPRVTQLGACCHYLSFQGLPAVPGGP